MPESIKVTKESIMREEEQIKDSVFSYFEKEKTRLANSAIRLGDYAESGAYEAQDGFIQASGYARAIENQISANKTFARLENKPYFAHIKLEIPSEGSVLHCLITQSEDLDTPMTINGADEETIIFPFKLDDSLKMFDCLYRAYQRKQGEKFTVDDLYGGTTYLPTLIRDTVFEGGSLLDVIPYLPKVEIAELIVDFDDLLAKRLDENRNDPRLRNIIATLQERQYDVVRKDVKQSFVVQGCAGSGKSQCLLHRLFFLRGELSKEWDKVLMISPSQLFRNYSYELARRFHIDTISNTSISELYREILLSIDQRFRNRQYKYELSEEYLPDEYLREVYSRENIDRIQREIVAAINTHVSEACSLLGREYPKERITIETAEALAKDLGSEIENFDKRERLLADDSEFARHRSEIDRLQKELDRLRNAQAKQIERIDELQSKRVAFNKLKEDLSDAENALIEWQQNRKDRIDKLKEKLEMSRKQLPNLHLSADDLLLLKQFYNALNEYKDTVYPDRRGNQSDEDSELFYQGYVDMCREKVQEFTNGKSETSWLNGQDKNEKEAADKLQNTTDDITLTELFIEDHTNWLAEHMQDDIYRSQNSARRSAMEKARFYLTRIESSVFEQEVWNSLMPSKEKCGIEATHIDSFDNGRHKETRILYKSDLLFYLKIYLELRECSELPEYKLICIDEGQDLHQIDYDLIKVLFPQAVLNVFGDTSQSLHEYCGISDWEQETGIRDVFTLDKNYRNTPAVVQFCRDRFSVNMESCGTVKNSQIPAILNDAKEIASILEDRDVKVVLKSRETFDAFSTLLRDYNLPLNYIDTHTEKEIDDTISCFSVYAAKGLEFSNVLVFPKEMNRNQNIVACTRALNHLYYYE